VADVKFNKLTLLRAGQSAVVFTQIVKDGVQTFNPACYLCRIVVSRRCIVNTVVHRPYKHHLPVRGKHLEQLAATLNGHFQDLRSLSEATMPISIHDVENGFYLDNKVEDPSVE
jgi:hypothetical protein